MRIVSLVPSVTDTLAVLGAGDAVVGVTDYCVCGAPPTARRVGGTKNPAVDEIVALAPDVVVANAEENRAADLDALRAAGLDVRVTYPKTVPDVAGLLVELAELIGADATSLVDELDAATADVGPRRPALQIAALTLIWRKPWMGLGPDTYADDLLQRCGLVNVLAGWQDRYPRLDPALVLAPEVILLPSEPYAFGENDLTAVHALLGPLPHRFVDGQLLTWHGHRTAQALRTFTALATAVADERDAGAASR
ncbi:MAG: ABC transporter substrate-binding protein [Euzebyaceae bacterium]|jgi:ABC-type Fe3+-hydroxamate transport system substrate-binding protein|nr:ABC transporter substrate-binding protein [Euzebyaceae bacterium]